MATKEEVYHNVQEVLVDALGVDQDDVTPQATLVGDLGAESIDFLDISFQLEKAFEPDCAADRPFKIEQGDALLAAETANSKQDTGRTQYGI